MGTVLELRVVAADKAEAARIAEQAAQLVTHWDDVLTTWRSAGQLYRFNQLAGKGSQPVSPDLAAALATMTRLSADTGGAFDPAVGPLVDHWRLDKAASHPTPARAPQPTPALRIATALELDGDSARLLADAAIDAGGIGKGLALDAATELLRGLGAGGAWLNLGGSSQAAFGTDALGRPWRMAVAGLASNASVHGSVVLDGRSLSTSHSGPAGDPAGTIVDPSSGLPVVETRLATVLADNGATAEAWSTALVVLGRMGVQAAHDAGVEAMYEDASGMISTPGFPLETSGTREPTSSPR